MTKNRYIVSQLLNIWVVRDTELLKAKKRSVVYETESKDDAEDVAKMCNDGQPITDVLNYHHVRNRGQ